jgi:hypothetical protein
MLVMIAAKQLSFRDLAAAQGALIDHSGIHRINRRVDGCYSANDQNELRNLLRVGAWWVVSLGSFRRAAQRGFNASFVAH